MENSFISPNQPITAAASLTKIPTLKIAPNPFYHNSIIQFSLPKTNKISLQVMDSSGRLVLNLTNNEVKEEGFHQTRFDADALDAGIYFIRLVMEKEVLTKKVVVWR